MNLRSTMRRTRSADFQSAVSPIFNRQGVQQPNGLGWPKISRFVRQQGTSLIECLLYIALFLVVATLAFASYYRVDEETRALSRNTDDIVRAMKAGEQWRADVRAATVPPRLENGSLKLATKSGDVFYSVSEGVVWRQAAPGKARPALERVKSSGMQPDARQHVTGWRWELELETKRAQTSVRPLFTFIAVSSNEVAR